MRRRGAWATNCISRWRVGTPSEQVSGWTWIGGQFGRDAQVGDAGFLGGLAQRRGDDIVVVVLAVPAQLHPATQPRVQGEQYLSAAVVEHQCRSGDVARDALAPAGVVAGLHEGQHRVPQRILGRDRALAIR